MIDGLRSGPTYLQVDCRLARSLILGPDYLTGGILISGVEARAVLGVSVHAIVHSTPATPVG